MSPSSTEGKTCPMGEESTFSETRKGGELEAGKVVLHGGVGKRKLFIFEALIFSGSRR